ncbi:MAG: extracellular ligand-binding receptor [Comamonadaceae bacterium]|nr:MAG: extracellular ligand-binding receptor [Comamonadaceae bacterium]
MKLMTSLAAMGLLFLLQTNAVAEILIGQTVGVTGAVAATVKESMQGAKLYLDAVNAKGGVHGEKVEVITLDDKFDTQLTLAHAKTLIEERKVLALFMTRGTPHTQGILPLLDQHGVPLIGPSTGAMVFHQPIQPHVFNVRAAYQREAEKAITHLGSIGITRIALVHVDDSFGTDALNGAQKGMAIIKLAPVLLAKFDRSKPDFSAIAPQVVKAEAQAVMVIGSGTAVVQGIKQIKAAGSGAQFITLSNNASEGFVKLLGEQGRGVIVTQVFPQSFNYALVKEASQLAKAQGVGSVSPAMLEGFASAKVLVEALRRSGPKPTREKLLASLDNLKFDLGGLEISYDKTNHTGLDFADLSIITIDGKFRR